MTPQLPSRGLPVDVYRNAAHAVGDCTNGGITSRAVSLVVVGILDQTRAGAPVITAVDELSQITEPSGAAPAVILVKRRFNGEVIYHLRPADDLGRTPMMGGNYAATSDSRFSRMIGGMYGAVAVHDRFEPRHG